MTKIDEPARPVDHINGRPFHYEPASGRWYRQAGPGDDPTMLLLPYEPEDDPAAIAWLAWRMAET